MKKLDEKKLARLKTGSQHLTEKYGEKGTPSREEFEAKAKAWYYAELLRDERKRQKLTRVYFFTGEGTDRYAALYVHAYSKCVGVKVLIGCRVKSSSSSSYSHTTKSRGREIFLGSPRSPII